MFAATGRLTDLICGSEAANALWSPRATVQAMLDVEAALARASALHGVIPASAVDAIVAACQADEIDAQALMSGAQAGGNLAIPLVKLLTAVVKARDAEAAKYVHWGATSQDIIDTGLMLQLRAALDQLDADLRTLATALAAQAQAHRATPMIGRTWLQQALPITLGLKFAQWLDAITRQRARLGELKARALVLQFGGAAGTLASLRDRALPVAQSLADDLHLTLPVLPWHTQRDRIAEAAAWFGMLTGTLGKIARDISLMMQTEVGEVAEPAAAGKGGSSTMPHKRNPVGCAAVLTAATRAPNLVATIFAGMVQEHERALGGWQAEWEALPDLARLAAGAVANLNGIVAGLEVNAERLTQNLDATHGLVLGEAVMLALGDAIGRMEAHKLVEGASKAAVANGRPLLEALAANETVMRHLSRAQLESLLDPANYVGQAQSFVDAAIANAHLKEPKEQERQDMPLAEVNGTRLHYRIDATAGDSAPWLVLSNSLGADVSMWTPNIEAFAQRYRVLRYDTRGHGHSDVPPGPYTIDQLIGDVIGLMDHLKIERAHYCGLSMGGLTGIGLAARHPERFARVVLSNTAALIGSDAVWTPRAAKAREPGGMPALTDAVIARWFTAPFIEREPLALANIRDVFRHTSGEGYASNCEAIRDADLRDEAKTITLPVLMIAGTHDLSTTAEQGRELAGYIEGARYLELDAAHLSNIEKRNEYTRAVLDFLGA